MIWVFDLANSLAVIFVLKLLTSDVRLQTLKYRLAISRFLFFSEKDLTQL